jgi:hypothetical protein
MNRASRFTYQFSPPGLADVFRSAGDAIGHRDGDARREKIVQNDMAVTGG